jgi:hypothetical protein
MKYPVLFVAILMMSACASQVIIDQPYWHDIPAATAVPTPMTSSLTVKESSPFITSSPLPVPASGLPNTMIVTPSPNLTIVDIPVDTLSPTPTPQPTPSPTPTQAPLSGGGGGGGGGSTAPDPSPTPIRVVGQIGQD